VRAERQTWRSFLGEYLGDVQQVAQGATIPVVNGRTTYNHPCEVLGDLAFIARVRESLDNLKVVFVGESTNLQSSSTAARSWAS
jgi:ornithine carbamoyltransferase